MWLQNQESEPPFPDILPAMRQIPSLTSGITSRYVSPKPGV